MVFVKCWGVPTVGFYKWRGHSTKWGFWSILTDPSYLMKDAIHADCLFGANGRNAREQFAAACMGRTTTTFAHPAESQGPRASADADHLHRWQSQSLRAISAPEAPSRCALITSGRAIPPHLSRLGSGAQSRWHPSAAGRFCHAPLCHRAISCEFLKPGVRLTRTRRLPEAFDTSLPAIRE